MSERIKETLNSSSCIRMLNEHGVDHIMLTHGHANTMELCRGIGEEYGAEHPKNLFLSNRSGTRFCLLLMDPRKPFVTGEVSKKLGMPRLGFGSEEALSSVLGSRPGCVSILCMTDPRAREAYSRGALKVAADKDVWERESVCVHPNTDEATLVIKTRELERFLREIGIIPEIVEI